MFGHHGPGPLEFCDELQYPRLHFRWTIWRGRKLEQLRLQLRATPPGEAALCGCAAPTGERSDDRASALQYLVSQFGVLSNIY